MFAAARLTAAVLATTCAVSVAAVPASASPGVRRLGSFERTQSILARAANGNLLIEAKARRAYMAVVTTQTDLYAIDLDSFARVGKLAIPPLLVAQTQSAEAEWLWTVDERHRRLFAFQEGAPDPDTSLENYALITVDLARFDGYRTTRIWPLSDRIPLTITYDERSDRLYILSRLKLEGDRRSAYFVEERRPDGSLVWEYRVKACYSALDFQHSPVLARSRFRPVIYLNCYGPQAVQGQVVRLLLDSTGRPSGAEEAFPAVPGDLSAAFDPGSDRMFFLTTNSGAGRGAWVFDGLRSTFLGVIASGDNRPGAFAYAMGVDPKTGRLYIHSPVGLILADARRTPLPAGLLFREFAQYGIGRIQIDPERRLLFVQDVTSANSVGHPTRYMLLEDGVPTSGDPPPGDPDALTTDVPERPGITGAHYAGSASAFAARSLLTGGVHRGTWNVAVGPYYAPESSPLWPTFQSVPVQTSNRDLFAARVVGAELSNDAADAAAILGASDYGTTKDVRDRGADWPFAPAECHDGGAAPASADDATGYVAASCDAKAATTRASAHAPGLESDVVAARSLFAHASVVRDRGRGVIARSAATVRGLDIAGLLMIDELHVEAETVARGRPGTAIGRFFRRLTGVRVDADRDGRPEFSCNVCTAADVEDAVNQNLGTQLRLSFPEPDARYYPRGSEGGFQSVVEKERYAFLASRALNDDDSTEVPGAEIVIFFDGRAGRTREVVQVAAVRAESHYGIYVIPRDETAPTPETPGAPRPVVAPVPTIAPVPKPPLPPVSAVPVVTKVRRRIPLGAGLFVSSPAEAGQLLLLWGLLAVPVYIVQRRRLIEGRS